MQGATPADLTVTFPEHPGLTINEAAAQHFGVPIDSRLRLSAQLVNTAPQAGAEIFTLPEAVNRALIQNPGYLARYEALEAATQAARQAWSAYLPSLVGHASVFYHDDNTVHNDDRFENTRYLAGLTLDQEILSLGTIREIQQAANNRDVSNAGLRQAMLDLEYAVAIAFLNCVKAENLLDIRKGQRRIIDECWQIARVRERLGEGNRADALRWEDELLQALRSQEAAELNLKIARILFNTLLGRPADMTSSLETNQLSGANLDNLLTMLLTAADNPGLRLEIREHLAREAAGHNPALEMQDLAVTGQRLRLKGNTATFMPRIGFRATLNLVDERRPKDTFAEEHVTWSAGARLELPLFLGTGRFKERKKLYAELSAQEYLKDDILLEVAGGIDIRLNSLRSLATQWQLAANSARLAREYLQLTIDQYAAGSRDISDLLESVANDRRTRIAATVDQAESYQAAAALVKEVGWSVHESGQSPDQLILSRLGPLVRDWLQR